MWQYGGGFDGYFVVEGKDDFIIIEINHVDKAVYQAPPMLQLRRVHFAETVEPEQNFVLVYRRLDDFLLRDADC